MEIGKDDLAPADHGNLIRLRLFDLDDHFGAGEYFRRPGDHFRPGLRIFRIRNARSNAGIHLDEYFVSRAGKLFGADRQNADAIFIRFDFLRNSNNHDISLGYKLMLHANVFDVEDRQFPQYSFRGAF